MASLRDLRRRIKSISSTQKITKAMKAVAAAKMRRAQENVLAARPFARRVRDVLGRVGSASVGMKHPLLAVREPQKVAYVIVTADRGLCGGFNANVIKASVQEMKKHQNADIITIGRKGRDYYRNRGYNIAQQYVGIGDANLDLTIRVANFVIDKYTAEEYDEVYLIYSQFVNVLVQKPVVQKILPVEPPEGEAGEKKVNYIFEPDAETIMGQILPMYIQNSIFQALLETNAGFYSAQMTAMDNATKNAADMIERLTLSMNRARQAAITTEITEIVSGAAALE
ncbi:ATP synthase F1 subunit gamma [Desulfallas thermosapovorans]|uniref:ATP synthase gamma chain n=1 Tax=Desulfallas thermosapovorans DSM 6562 TaxID=1121431 RepID=A0A5S4ZV19_9FIRM|nr:ATP synthase F1 subunit gamma [Desulfallas thermosapovorans]TYO96565.1 ATP synthase F1 subcomplex gamma subunit [Desulfallas thermosapovorans DSM 6562]